MPIAETPPVTAVLISEMIARGDGRARALIGTLEEAIREDGREGSGSYPLRFSTIARSIQYLALALHEAKRSGSSRKLQPQWAEVLALYESFIGAYPALDLLPKAITDDDLVGLCGFSTKRSGSQKLNFYSAMVLFFTYIVEERKIGDAEMDFIRSCAPEGERDFAARIGEWFRTAFTPGSQEQVDQASRSKARRHEFPIVNIGYTYHPSRNEDFRPFFEHFAVEADGNAHFVCYRPRNEHPDQLVKSFLVIRSPAVETETFRFVHIYQMPSKGSQRRISIGTVLPLEGGICLVGGQRQMTAQKERTVPFTNLKIVVLPWAAISIRERIFGGLAMSADYSGENLVSRIALRCTPIAHSDNITLDAIPLSQLEKDISQDLTRERGLVRDEDDRFRIVASNGARRIEELANNYPTHWDPPPAFYELGRQQTITRNLLEKHHIQEAIADRLGSDNDPKFRTKDGTQFRFWRHLRFGPITGE